VTWVGQRWSNLGYRRRKTVYDYDADAIDIPDYQAGRADGSIAVPLDPSASVENGDTTRIYNAEIHLSGTTLAGKLDWLAGTEYFAEESVSYILTGRTPTTANLGRLSCAIAADVRSARGVRYAGLCFDRPAEDRGRAALFGRPARGHLAPV
jgi:hypothetical protein